MALVDGVATPEDCCRLCSQQYEGSAAANASVPCNAWNHCGRDEGCVWAGSKDKPTPLRLVKGQCELRFQELSDINAGSPFFVEVGGCRLLVFCPGRVLLLVPPLPLHHAVACAFAPVSCAAPQPPYPAACTLRNIAAGQGGAVGVSMRQPGGLLDARPAWLCKKARARFFLVRPVSGALYYGLVLGGSAHTIWTVSDVLASQRGQHCLPSATRAALWAAGTTALAPCALDLTALAHQTLLTMRPRAAFKTRSACRCPSNRVRHCMPQLA